MDEKTARKYRSLGTLPSAQQRPRTYRTRRDPLAELWPLALARLEAEPRLKAKTLFDWLQREHPGQLTPSHRRTFERRVRQWRALFGAARPVMFQQVHHAGDLAASDFTHMNELRITILGQPFDHLVYHFVLTYSNWESVTVCPSESFEALSDGLQNALWELGGVPRRHRSDSLTAAVNNLSAKREFQTRYLGLLEHYGLAGERINVRQPRRARRARRRWRSRRVPRRFPRARRRSGWRRSSKSYGCQRFGRTSRPWRIRRCGRG